MSKGNFTFQSQLSAMARGRLKSSAISEIGNMIAEKGALSFGAGEPSDETFPKAAFRAAMEKALMDPDIWGYFHDVLGDPALRCWIAERMRADDMAPEWVETKDIVITYGAAGAVSLAAEALLDEGSPVLVEGPTYSDSLLTFRRQGAVCIPVPSDADGIIPEELARIPMLREARFLYTIPNFQNPSGCTTPLKRRLHILELLRENDVAILEDDPYHYLGSDPPPTSYLKLAGDDRRVIHCNTFSKTLAPGLRIGWAVIPPILREAFIALRTCDGLGSPLLLQRAILYLLEAGDFKERVTFLQGKYRVRRGRMLELLARFLTPLGLKTNKPSGGFFIWAEAPDDLRGFDSGAFARYAVEREKIGVIPGSAFFPEEVRAGDRAFRLSCAKIPMEEMEEGMKRLARAWTSFTSSLEAPQG